MTRRRFEDDDDDRGPPRRQSSSGLPIILVVGGVLGVFFVGAIVVAVGAFLFLAQPSAPQAVAPPPTQPFVEPANPPIVEVGDPPLFPPEPFPPPPMRNIDDPFNNGRGEAQPAPVVPQPVPPKPRRPKLPSAKFDKTIDLASLKEILAEKYPKPKELRGEASNSMKVVSSEGDYIGQGKQYAYELKPHNIRPTNYGGGVALAIDGWNVEFAPPRKGMEELKVGVHRDAKRFPFNDDTPGLSFSGNGRGNNTLSGSYAIWELELDGKEVVAFAADFVQRGEGTGPPLYGTIRFNSKFE